MNEERRDGEITTQHMGGALTIKLHMGVVGEETALLILTRLQEYLANQLADGQLGYKAVRIESEHAVKTRRVSTIRY